MLPFVAVLALLGLVNAQATETSEETFTPTNGPFNEIPTLGFGTWMLDDAANATEAVAQAMVNGYRMFDCATAYLNQVAIGKGLAEGLKRTKLNRSDIWVTSKLWSTRHGDKIQSGHEANLQQLGLDYIDMELMHFPIGTANGKPEYDFVKTWKEMEKLVAPGNRAIKGKSRFIGISNFNVTQVQTLLKSATIKPKVHQNELHPYLQQNAFVAFHKRVGIQMTAYAPLGDTNRAYRAGGSAGGRYMKASKEVVPLLQNPVLKSIAEDRGCTVAQVSIAWNFKRGITAVHPKAARVDHQKENFRTYECELTDDDMDDIKDIEKTIKFRMWDPCPVQLGLPCYVGLEGGNESNMTLKRAFY